MNRIKEKSRKGNFSMEELSGGTFILSNLGMFRVDAFTAIVNAPNGAILSVGRMTEEPVVLEGEITVRRRMRICLNMDHRMIDGATGAKFLTDLAKRLETIGE